ncbi:MAG: hypothetical protein MUO76_09900, partial [Anaerolineaceae bacterium]|nr:hypothetical protein [Anaerolineaceae bacterium]
MFKNRYLYLALALLAIGALLLGACGPKALGSEGNPLIMAVVPSGDTETVVTGFEEIAAMIFDETGLVVEPFVATEYAGVIEAMCSDPPKAHIASLAT